MDRDVLELLDVNMDVTAGRPFEVTGNLRGGERLADHFDLGGIASPAIKDGEIWNDDDLVDLVHTIGGLFAESAVDIRGNVDQTEIGPRCDPLVVDFADIRQPDPRLVLELDGADELLRVGLLVHRLVSLTRAPLEDLRLLAGEPLGRRLKDSCASPRPLPRQSLGNVVLAERDAADQVRIALGGGILDAGDR